MGSEVTDFKVGDVVVSLNVVSMPEKDKNEIWKIIGIHEIPRLLFPIKCISLSNRTNLAGQKYTQAFKSSELKPITLSRLERLVYGVTNE